MFIKVKIIRHRIGNAFRIYRKYMQRYNQRKYDNGGGIIWIEWNKTLGIKHSSVNPIWTWSIDSDRSFARNQWSARAYLRKNI